MAHPGIEMIAGFLAESDVMSGTVLERREKMAAATADTVPPEGVEASPDTLGDRPAEWLVPDGVGRDRVVLHLHGGGYCTGSLGSHREFAGRLALASGSAFVALDYRLAPEDPFPAALDDTLAAYADLLARGIAPTSIGLAGDSAGGGLVAATLLSIRDSGLPMPGAGVCLSPWVDLTQSSPSCRDTETFDPVLTTDDLVLMAEAYLDGTDPTNPLASPLFAEDLSGFPPLLVEVGEDEPLLDDAVSLAGRVGATGSEVVLNIWPEMVHVFQVFPGSIVPEADESIAGIGRFLATHLAAGAVDQDEGEGDHDESTQDEEARHG